VTKSPGHRFGLAFVVFRPRPEEAAQSVAFTARHDVHVQVRHALADTVVDGYERPLRFHCSLDRDRKNLNIAEERACYRRRQISKSFDVLLRDQEYVACEHGSGIEKRD